MESNRQWYYRTRKTLESWYTAIMKNPTIILSRFLNNMPCLFTKICIESGSCPARVRVLQCAFNRRLVNSLFPFSLSSFNKIFSQITCILYFNYVLTWLRYLYKILLLVFFVNAFLYICSYLIDGYLLEIFLN